MSLLERYPGFLQESHTFAVFQAGLQQGIDLVSRALEQFQQNLFLETADDYGLRLWEGEYGVSPKAGDTLLDRRSALAAMLRGQGTATKAMLKAMAAAFSNGQAEIDEDNENSRFVITFVGTLGTPPNMGDLSAAIDRVKPAHLEVRYVFLFQPYGDLTRQTHGVLAQFTHDDLREGKKFQEPANL